MLSALRGVAGVRSAERIAGAQELRVMRDGTKLNDAELTKAISNQGYRATVVPTSIQRFTVAGLQAAGAETKARDTLYAVKGTKVAAVSKSRSEAIVQFDTRHTSSARLIAALAKAGFSAKAK